MIDYGLVMGTANGIFSPDDYVTVEQIEIMIGRMWSYYGTNLRDDFYSTVNKDALNSAAISPGESAGGTFYTLNSQNNRRVANIIRGLVTKNYQDGTKEQKISDYYHACLLYTSRCV